MAEFRQKREITKRTHFRVTRWFSFLIQNI